MAISAVERLKCLLQILKERARQLEICGFESFREAVVDESQRFPGLIALAAFEEQARQHGRWLLVLDTVPGESGHRLYLRAGWQQSGTVPDYALFPDGRLCDTAIMWKRLKR